MPSGCRQRGFWSTWEDRPVAHRAVRKYDRPTDEH
jgi:hypothetical protein